MADPETYPALEKLLGEGAQEPPKEQSPEEMKANVMAWAIVLNAANKRAGVARGT